MNQFYLNIIESKQVRLAHVIVCNDNKSLYVRAWLLTKIQPWRYSL